MSSSEFSFHLLTPGVAISFTSLEDHFSCFPFFFLGHALLLFAFIFSFQTTPFTPSLSFSLFQVTSLSPFTFLFTSCYALLPFTFLFSFSDHTFLQLTSLISYPGIAFLLIFSRPHSSLLSLFFSLFQATRFSPSLFFSLFQVTRFSPLYCTFIFSFPFLRFLFVLNFIIGCSAMSFTVDWTSLLCCDWTCYALHKQ